MTETLQDIQIEEYLLNKHDYDLISKYTQEGQVEKALQKPIQSLKSDINTMIHSKKLLGQN
jgi:hypothetical protein